MKQTQAANDQKKIMELEAWGQQQQQKHHLQGFGTAPVQDCLKPIEKQLPAIAQKAGVDIIVNKWQIDYQTSQIELVDLTDAIVALYKPDAKTLQIVKNLNKWKPLSEEKLLNLKD